MGERVELGPGIYSQDGELHIDAAEVCRSMGVPPTPSNQAVLEHEARRLARERGIPVDVDEGPGTPLEFRRPR